MNPSYAGVLDYLFGLQQHGIKLGLETIRALLERAGRPQARYRCLHVGGTNGKGSTSAIAASILQAAGYRVGLYTSPHLVDFSERIRVNGAPISEESVCRVTQRLRALLGSSLSPTFFEFTTALAFQHFADTQVDVAVLEVGMGGRFDATNVITPAVAAITNVALDHQQYLGSSVASIAYEKAGIIKPRVPAVAGRLCADAREVVRAAATERGAPLLELGHDFFVEGEHPAAFRYRGLGVELGGLSCPLEGRHQLDNAACALALVELARDQGLDAPESAVREGMGSVRWEGRLEIAERHPFLLLDGAHNPAAAESLARYLAGFRHAHPGARVILLIGMMRDKDWSGFCSAVCPEADEVVVTEPSIPRSASVGELRSAVCAQGGSLHTVPVPADALAYARRLAAREDVICVTGSLMLVGEVKALLRGCGLSPIRG